MKNVRRFIALAASSLLLASAPALAYDQEILFRDLPREMDIISFRDAVLADVAEIPDPDTILGNYVLESSCSDTYFLKYYDPDSSTFFSSYHNSREHFPFYQSIIVPNEGETFAGYPNFVIHAQAIPLIIDDKISLDPSNSCVINAWYSLSCKEGEPVAEIGFDLLSKLKSIYGDFDFEAHSENSYQYAWYGANNTYLVLSYTNFGMSFGSSFNVEYGLSDSKERIEKLALQPTIEINNADTSGL